jgi:hypothetical protein
MIVQSGHHNHSIECTLFFPWYCWWLYKVDIIIIVSNVPCSFPDTADDCTKCTSLIVMSTLYNHQLYQGKNKVHSILWLWCPLCTIISCIRVKTRYIRYYDCDVHFVSIECTLFLPWYSWWLYKVDITIIVSNVPCFYPDIADDCTKWTSQYIRYYDCDVHFVQSSAVSGKEQGTFDTMIVMSTLYNHQLYQGKNKECTLFFPWYSWWLYKVDITIIVSNVPCSFPDIADDCTKWTSQS